MTPKNNNKEIDSKFLPWTYNYNCGYWSIMSGDLHVGIAMTEKSAKDITTLHNTTMLTAKTTIRNPIKYRNPTDPIKLLEELDAYLSFRLCCETPSIPHTEILNIKKSIRAALDERSLVSTRR